MRTRRLLLLGALAAVSTAPLEAQRSTQLDSATLAGFRWRQIGPANMGGRVADIDAIPSPSKTFYVATATGGIWKTTNAGTTFRPVFENERVISMGAIAIAPSDTNVVYAGTGEPNSRNSISPGGGLWKTTDGGKTWTLMGLTETQHIGRIVVHPTDANTAYVAALGHAWGPNKERGLYKTTDGGRSWQLVKFISDRAGFVDVVMDPRDPSVLYASSYERVRGPWFLRSGGPGSALWKTTDAGKTWAEVTGGGFPTATKGRIGLAISRSNPDVLYALVEADSSPNPKGRRGVGTPQERQTGLYRTSDAGKTWTKMDNRSTRPFYYSQVRVDPTNPDRVYWSSTPVLFSDEGGKNARTATNGIHVDHHAMWIDPNDPDHMIVGNDGGVAVTWDKGGNYDFLDVMPLGQFYEVSYNMEVPYRVCGGLQDNGSWCGPSRRRSGAITNADWFNAGGGDGFYTQQDPTDPSIIYSESQGGNIGRLDLRTGERVGLVRPSWRPRYTQIEDSILIERGDTTRPVSREQTRRITELRARQRADSAELDMRFNWNTPFFLSPHSPTTFYAAGNRVLKSTNRGEGLYPISPDLSKRQMDRIEFSMRKTGGITVDATGAETYGTVTALAESPVRPGLLYAGTDDGNVWITRNDGAAWENLTTRFPGLPAETYVARIEPSHFDTATFYVAFDNHRRNDFAPYLYVTTDYGRTFRSIADGLPTGGPDFLHVVREDPVNRDLLFVGTDVGAYVSLDRGRTWQKFMTGMPTVPVHDLQIHPRDHELIAATHGRSIMIVDIAPLQQIADSVLAARSYLFQPKTAFQYGEEPRTFASAGHKHFAAPSAPYGAEIAYRLARPMELLLSQQRSEPAERAEAGEGAGRRDRGGRDGRAERVKIVITDVRGDTVRTLEGPARPGLHRVTWDFRGKVPPPPPLSPAGRRDSIVNARKIAQLIDSLAAAGVASRPVLDRARDQLVSGGAGDFFRRRGGNQPGDRFVERPGEGPAPRQRGQARPARADTAARAAEARSDTARVAAADTAALRGERVVGERAMGGEAGGEDVDPEVMNEVFSALRRAGLTTGGFGGRTGPPTVESGDYLVSMTVDGVTHRRVLRVERADEGRGTAVATGAGRDR